MKDLNLEKVEQI